VHFLQVLLKVNLFPEICTLAKDALEGVKFFDVFLFLTLFLEISKTVRTRDGFFVFVDNLDVSYDSLLAFQNFLAVNAVGLNTASAFLLLTALIRALLGHNFIFFFECCLWHFGDFILHPV